MASRNTRTSPRSRRSRGSWRPRRALDGLIVLAVAGLAAAAIVDAVRDGGAEATTRSPERGAVDDDERDRAASASRSAGLVGTIVYTDLTCELRTLGLPELRPVASPVGPPVGCEFELSPDGERVAPRDAAWSGGHAAYALCSGGNVQVYRPPSGRPEAIIEGCAPAWRPGPPAVLTVARAAGIVEVSTACEGRGRCEPLISREALLDAAARHPNVPDDSAALERIDVKDVVWLSSRRVAVLLRLVLPFGENDLIALFENGRVRDVYAVFDDELEELEASPDGAAVASEPEVLAFRDSGERIAVPDDFGPIAAVAWSPDGRRLALAADGAIVIVAPGERQIRIPVTAADLAWR